MKNTGKNNTLRGQYIFRINNVLDYIEQNIDKKLHLKTLSGVANFSPFHFHRIFQSMVGETVNQFIQRVRIEKAANMLISNLKKSITEVAFDSGFSSSATFSRAFREFFEMTPSEWRNKGSLTDRKISKTESKKSQEISNIGKDLYQSICIFDNVTGKQIWRLEMKKGIESKLEANVEVKEIASINVAYLRHIGPYIGDVELFESLFGKLVKWAGPRGLINFPETQFISVYHDNPDITDENKHRLSVCLTVPENTKGEGEVGTMIIEGGTYAVAHFEISDNEYESAWASVYGKWLPDSGYQPVDRPCFELYLNDPKEHPENKHIVDIHIPVKPL